MVRPHRRAFTVIDGGKAELERKKRILFSQPWAFDHDEFDRLCGLLRLSRHDVFDLTMMRIEHKAETDAEARAALDVLCGRAPLSSIKAARQRSNFRIAVSAPPVLPRSSSPTDESHS